MKDDYQRALSSFWDMLDIIRAYAKDTKISCRFMVGGRRVAPRGRGTYGSDVVAAFKPKYLFIAKDGNVEHINGNKIQKVSQNTSILI